MTARRAAVHIRRLPSLNATQRAIGVAYSDGHGTRRSLRYAYAVLAVVVMEQDYGRIVGWSVGRRAHVKGYAIYNARTALERLRARLEPLDFDVDYRIPRPANGVGAAENTG